MVEYRRRKRAVTGTQRAAAIKRRRLRRVAGGWVRCRKIWTRAVVDMDCAWDALDRGQDRAVRVRRGSRHSPAQFLPVLPLFLNTARPSDTPLPRPFFQCISLLPRFPREREFCVRSVSVCALRVLRNRRTLAPRRMRQPLDPEAKAAPPRNVSGEARYADRVPRSHHLLYGHCVGLG